MRTARSALQPYTYMRGPDFLGLALGGLVTWLLSGRLDKPHLALLFVAIWLPSSYVFLYIKKRLGWVQLSWRQMLVLELRGYAIAAVLFFILDRIGWLPLSSLFK